MNVWWFDESFMSQSFPHLKKRIHVFKTLLSLTTYSHTPLMWRKVLKRASPRRNPSHMDLCFSCLPTHIHFLYKLCLVVLSNLSVPMPCWCFLVCIHLCCVFSGLSQTMGYTAWHCPHSFWWFCEVWLVWARRICADTVYAHNEHKVWTESSVHIYMRF